jgi:glyoxylase-like metal-dependent hydrolase (beta-lactamase superfamily II)
MGRTKYGDCLLIQGGGKTILVDGGHPGDWKGKQGYQPIPDQLARLLGRQPPFTFSLLVVTHCHSDHIGCLPKLVADGTVEAEWALVADEYLGFG